MANSKVKKRCFVVMGFGKKTDYVTGRELDLDKSYQLLIKPVVEEKGIICLRADEITHSGVIDVVMYQELLKADVVIADLSTANLNAIYELGVRHALKPYTTIIISEEKLTHPFNLNHISICNYKHSGDDIGYTEVERFRKILRQKIEDVLEAQTNDSPVYAFLEGLVPPALQAKTSKSIKQISDAVEQAGEEQIALEEKQTKEDLQQNKPTVRKTTLRKLTQQGEEALRTKKFAKAKGFFQKAVDLGTDIDENRGSSIDPYLIHSLALATYKAEKPTAVAALNKSLELLSKLDLEHTNDPKTVALAGAIEKKLYESEKKVEHLSNSILYFERGYYLLNNRYHAINLAYMLICRANSSLDGSEHEKIADMVAAKRVWKRVLILCEKDWKNCEKNGTTINEQQIDEELRTKQTESNNEQRFWILANRAEAYFGLGLLSEYENSKAEALSLKPEDSMVESFTGQVEALGKLLNKQKHLISSE